MDGDLWPHNHDHHHHHQHRRDHDHRRHENGRQAVRGSLNIAQLLRCRREGRIPSSAGAGVLGGHTSARSASAEMRGSGMRSANVDMSSSSVSSAFHTGVGRSPFGFRRSMMEHPFMINRLGHAVTMRGHTREWTRASESLQQGRDDRGAWKSICCFMLGGCLVHHGVDLGPAKWLKCA